MTQKSAPRTGTGRQVLVIAAKAVDTQTAIRNISGYHLRCATCQQPIDPAPTAAGHLTQLLS